MVLASTGWPPTLSLSKVTFVLVIEWWCSCKSDLFFYHPADSSAGSVGAPGELLKLSGRHLGRLQDPVGDLLVRGEVPQAISTVATSGPVVEDCWSVSLLLFQLLSRC